MKKRIISLLMYLVMAFSIVPAAAWAEVLPSPQDTPDSGAGTAGVYTTGEDTTSPATGDAGLVVYAAIARAAAPARRCCCAASASTNNAEDDRPLAGHLLLPTAGKSGIIGIYETRRKEHGL